MVEPWEALARADSGPVVADLLRVVLLVLGVGRQNPVGRLRRRPDGEILPADFVC